MNDEAAVHFLLELLEIESLTGQEAEAASFVANRMEHSGLETQLDEAGNAIGSTGPKAGRELLFLGHIDTVPGSIEAAQKGDVIFGRGAVDAKGPLAAAIVAASRCAAVPGLTIVAASGEEGLSHGARHLLDRESPQALVIGEPSGSDSVVLGYKGSMRASLTFEQATGHSAGPVQGVCDVAVDAWGRTRDVCAKFSQGTGQFRALTPTLLGFNSTSDGLSDRASLRATFRLPPNLDLDAAKRSIKDAVEPGDTCFEQADAGYMAAKSSPIVSRFLRALRSEEITPRFKYKTGTSDMNVVAPAWGCPAVAYGPGDSSLDHTPQEHIKVDEYLLGIRVLTRVFSDWS